MGRKWFQHLFNVARHRESYRSAGGNLDIHAMVSIAFIFYREFVAVALKRLNELISISAGSILDAEVIHDEAKLNISSGVTEEARGIRRPNVSVCA